MFDYLEVTSGAEIYQLLGGLLSWLKFNRRLQLGSELCGVGFDRTFFFFGTGSERNRRMQCCDTYQSETRKRPPSNCEYRLARSAADSAMKSDHGLRRTLIRPRSSCQRAFPINRIKRVGRRTIGSERRLCGACLLGHLRCGVSRPGRRGPNLCVWLGLSWLWRGVSAAGATPKGVWWPGRLRVVRTSLPAWLRERR
jgi:hypothetical protein